MFPNMVCNVDDRTRCIFSASSDHVREVSLVDLHISVEGAREGGNLHVVAVGASTCHILQVALEHAIDFFRRGRHEGCGGGVCTGILAFGIATDAAAGVDVDKLLVVVGMLSHVVDDARADGEVVILVAVELVGEGVEETVA